MTQIHIDNSKNVKILGLNTSESQVSGSFTGKVLCLKLFKEISSIKKLSVNKTIRTAWKKPESLSKSDKMIRTHNH